MLFLPGQFHGLWHLLKAWKAYLRSHGGPGMRVGVRSGQSRCGPTSNEATASLGFRGPCNHGVSLFLCSAHLQHPFMCHLRSLSCPPVILRIPFVKVSLTSMSLRISQTAARKAIIYCKLQSPWENFSHGKQPGERGAFLITPDLFLHPCAESLQTWSHFLFFW